MTAHIPSDPAAEAEIALREAFNGAALARDAAGFFGTPAECIEHLSEENDRLLADIAAMRTEHDHLKAMEREPIGDLGDEIRRLEGECRIFITERDAARTENAALRTRAEEAEQWLGEATAAVDRTELERDGCASLAGLALAENMVLRGLNEPAEARATTLATELAKARAEVARLTEALTEIAQATPEPDDKQWRDVWNDPAAYRWRGTDGEICETSVDTSNHGDTESFGYERGLHAAAVLARRALKPEGVSDDAA